MNKTKISLPQNDRDKFIKFSNYKHKEKVPFVIYADIESILEKCDDFPSITTTTTTKKFQKHIPCNVAYYLISTYHSNLSRFNFYTGQDCVSWFCKQLQSLAFDIY